MTTPKLPAPRPSGLPPAGSSRLEGIIAGLAKLDLDQLRQEWAKRLKRPPPRCRSVGVMRGMLAWALQEEAYGGFSADTRRRLRELGNTMRRNGGLGTQTVGLMPGTVLTREWRGTLPQGRRTRAGVRFTRARRLRTSRRSRALLPALAGPDHASSGSEHGAHAHPPRATEAHGGAQDTPMRDLHTEKLRGGSGPVVQFAGGPARGLSGVC